MRSAITICLVPEARKGPFVFHYDAGLAGLEVGCRAAAEFGFDAVEIFPGSAAMCRQTRCGSWSRPTVSRLPRSAPGLAG